MERINFIFIWSLNPMHSNHTQKKVKRKRGKCKMSFLQPVSFVFQTNRKMCGFFSLQSNIITLTVCSNNAKQFCGLHQTIKVNQACNFHIYSKTYCVYSLFSTYNTALSSSRGTRSRLHWNIIIISSGASLESLFALSCSYCMHCPSQNKLVCLLA